MDDKPNLRSSAKMNPYLPMVNKPVAPNLILDQE